MSFDLFGFEFLIKDSIYGVWIMGIKDWEDFHRCLFCIHYAEEEFRVELLFMRLI